MASGCLARASTAWLRSRAAEGLLRPAGQLPWISRAQPQQRRASQQLRAQSTAAPPYWDDDSKPRVNVYSDYTIYKGKAAMAIKVIKPTWESIGSGLKISREGTLLLEFAASVGPQQYDWTKKETFGLSALECAAVLEAADARQSFEALHDPNKGRGGEGTVYKKFNMRPAPDKGWFFSIASTASGSQVNISCNVSDAELRLVTRVFDFVIPRLLGFDEHFAGAPSVVMPESAAAAAPAEAAAPF